MGDLQMKPDHAGQAVCGLPIGAAPGAPTGGASSGNSARSEALNAGVEAQPHELRQRTARGAIYSAAGQFAGVFLRMASMVVLARLVTPEQFGLVGMVAAFTGFLALFRDAGLSMATVQRPTITHGQTSTLFWINVATGALLTVLCVVAAPMLAAFFKEPRLFLVTVALGIGFLFYGVSAQHRALLQRNMRFGVLTLVDTASLLLSIVVAVAAAWAGMGYWALVIQAVSQPMAAALGIWFAAGWTPGLPRRGTGVRSMLEYGGLITLNSLVVYLAYNAEKVLLGRYWGAEVLGLYGRAYQLINLPTENLNSVIGSVMFPALSRVQQDPARLRNYFLKGYGQFLALVTPITVACALFADDIVLVLLGAQWTGAVPAFRLLAPTILAFALINPLAWLMQSCGYARRSLKMAFIIAPVTVLGYLVGLPHGPQGVAIGFSAAMLLLVVPMMLWARHGTPITMRDMLLAAKDPTIATLAGAAAALGAAWLMRGVHPALLRLCVVCATLFGGYLLVLLFVLGHKQQYLDLLHASGVWKSQQPETSTGGQAGGREK